MNGQTNNKALPTGNRTIPNERLEGEYRAFISIIESNSLVGLRSARDFIPKHLYLLQTRLNQAKSTEGYILQRLRRDLDIDQVERIRADLFMRVDPMEAYAHYDPGFPDPHERLTYDRNALLSLAIGVKDQIAELDKICHTIKYIESEIRMYKDLQNKVNEALKKIEDKDLEKDNITLMRMAGVAALYQLHTFYRNKTIVNVQPDGTGGQRKFTEDPKTVYELEQIQRRFIALAEVSPYVISGQITLDLNDPGSDQNGTALKGLIEKLRKTTLTTKVEKKVQAYIDSLERNLTDGFVAQEVKRRDTSKYQPEPSNSLAAKTTTLGEFLNYTVESHWWTKLSFGTNAEAVENTFKYFITGLYNGRPICGRNWKYEEKVRNDTEEEKDKSEAAAVKEIKKQDEQAVQQPEKPRYYIDVISIRIPATDSASINIKVSDQFNKVYESTTLEGTNTDYAALENKSEAYLDQLQQKYTNAQISWRTSSPT